MKTLVKDTEIKNIVEKCELQHIAIIMDGNRRWAKTKNLPSSIGHKNGVNALKTTLKACAEFGIKHLTVYAFSTENWNRTEEEVRFLMDLLAETLKTQLNEMHENNVKIKFIGNIENLPQKLKTILHNAQDLTLNNTGVNLHIAFNYGARDEIVNAVKKIVQQNIEPDKITEELISENLYTKGVSDPDLLIRTGGERRISNYLLWQIAYSEIIVMPEFWPEFDKQSLADCILEFQNRKRRFGK